MSQNETQAFSQKLRELIKERGLNLQEAAAAIGVEYVTLSRYLNGSVFPRRSTLRAISTFFNIPVEQLISPSTVYEKGHSLLRLVPKGHISPLVAERFRRAAFDWQSLQPPERLVFEVLVERLWGWKFLEQVVKAVKGNTVNDQLTFELTKVMEDHRHVWANAPSRDKKMIEADLHMLLGPHASKVIRYLMQSSSASSEKSQRDEDKVLPHEEK